MTSDSVGSKKDVQLPQAGYHVALPLKNGAFDKNTIVAEFADDGTLTRFDYITDAQAEGLAQALASTAKTATEILDARKSKEFRELQAKTDLLKAEAAFIEAERTLRTLKDETIGGSRGGSPN